jgi:hypothetical protein
VPPLLMELAHPLTEEGVLPISPLLAAVVAGCVVAACGLYWPTRRPLAVRPEQGFDSWEGRLTPGQVAGRALSVALVGLAVAAGRLGSERELENLAPALVIGTAWPGLLVLSATLGSAWRWVDPWDGIARLFDADDRPSGAPSGGDVRLAVVPALAWTWYLGVYPDTLSPRSVGLVLGAYVIAMVGGCLAVGRIRWLARVEPFGILFGWVARLPRGLLREWTPPRGVSALLGVLAGGLIFGEIRRTELWGELNVVPGAVLWPTLALIGSAAAGAAVLHLLERWASREEAPGSVPAASVAAIASIAVAVSMARSRLFTSIQLLPTVLADPFGFGWDLLGTAGGTLEAPLDAAPLATVQLVVLLAGHVAGAMVLAGRRPGSRIPGAAALALLMAAATGALVLAPGL